jgi:NADH-quinone oxidoreductase subunit N
MTGFQLTARDIYGIMPLIILAATGMVVLLWDAFEKRPSRTPLALTLLGTIATIVAAVINLNDNQRVCNGMLLDNSFSNYFAILFAAAAALAVLLAERYLKEEEVFVGEFSGLVLFSACGMIMLAAGTDLIMTFLGLETMSIAFYVLSGLFRRRAESNEAALKYFLLGSFSTGFFLYGIALMYGTFATTNIDAISKALSTGGLSAATGNPVFWVSIGLLIVGFSFKIAAFPFHQWAPDVYEGAPTVVSGFMSTAGKAGAFGAMLVIFNMALQPIVADHAALGKLQLLLGVIALASMFYGNITAMAQSHVKRMLAYSSIAHAGYMLLGIAAMSRDGVTAVSIYLAVYTLMQLGAFGVVGILEKDSAAGLELKDYAGLAKRRPWLAFMMAIMMLSLAGIPPFAGFFGKYYLFSAAIRSGMTMYAVLGVIASLISVYFYLRVLVLMYFREAEEPATALGVTPSGSVAIGADTVSAWVALAITAIGLLLLGVLPAILTNVAGGFYAH